MQRGETSLCLDALPMPEVGDKSGAEVLVSKETHPQNVIAIHALKTEAHPASTGSLELDTQPEVMGVVG